MKSNSKRIVVVVGLVLIGVAAPAMAQRGRLADGWNERNGPQVLAAFKPVVADAGKCTVRVFCDGKETVLGTVVGSEGWIATKYSELHDPIVCRLPDGKQLPAKLVGYDQPYDLAMLKIDAKDLKTVDWSDDDKGPAVGQLLATATQGELPKGIGVVSVPRRAIPARPPMPKAILGVRPDPGEDGVTIASITFNSAAARAGLKVGDLVTRIDDQVVKQPEKMIEIMRQHNAGDKVTLQLRRGDADLTITATLTKPPASRSDNMNAMGSELSRVNSGFSSIIEHDTVLQSSECGGPLVDLSGKVVGINIARAGRVETYAVPADQVRAILADMESGKLAPKTMLAGAADAKPADKPDEKPAEAKAEK